MILFFTILSLYVKIYIADAAIRNAVLMDSEVLTNPVEMGKMVETSVYKHVAAFYYQKGTKVIAGEKTIDTFNSITNNDFLNSYREKLHREANFSENKTDFSGKNGFKRDFLFILYLKDALFFIAKLTILVFLLIILKRLVLNQKVI